MALRTGKGAEIHIGFLMVLAPFSPHTARMGKNIVFIGLYLRLTEFYLPKSLAAPVQNRKRR
jgi:hypothetical protein